MSTLDRTQEFLESEGVSRLLADVTALKETVKVELDPRAETYRDMEYDAETTTFELVDGAVMVADPKSGGVKGVKPQRMELLPWDVLRDEAEHYAQGAHKYEDRNWERGYAYSSSFAALQRHLAAWWQGEDDDPEFGASHLRAVIFHALALRAFEMRGVGTDDRPAGG